MLKVFNKDPHFMRDAVKVDNYTAAWDIICSMQERLGQGILLVAERHGRTLDWPSISQILFGQTM